MAYNNPKYNKMLDELLSVCKQNFSSVNEELLIKAFDFAIEAHKNDKRISGVEYIEHPYEVALIVAKELLLDDTTVISALLHDTLEDTDITYELIQKEFGDDVAEIVDGVTKISGLFRGHEIILAENYRKMLVSMVKDVRVILVKFADRLHNMRTLDPLPPYKQRRIAHETLEIYAPFANRFGLAQLKGELEDLSFKYLNRVSYDEISHKLSAKRDERENFIKKFSEPIIAELNKARLNYEISGRAKHLYSIYRKMVQRNKPFEEIYDLVAVRIILESNKKNDCYTALGIVNQCYPLVEGRLKDYISIPKQNKYQSIHTTVIGPNGKGIEVQIRTREMHEIAERGIAAHWKYKERNSKSEKDMDIWINWVRDIFEPGTKDEDKKTILENLKANLYQDEIYVFTPKGDIRRLPQNSTPIDFAFEIHSNIGYHCIGAKVNTKIVPLDTKLNSGEQVEIIISKNQHPNKNWLKFVVTPKAKNAIKRYLNKEEEEIVNAGKANLEKKIKKLKLNFTQEDINKLSLNLKFENTKNFFKSIAQGKINLDDVLTLAKEKGKKEKVSVLEFNSFASASRNDLGGVLVEDKINQILYSYAKCCNPIPGDAVIGYVTVGEGIKIHRKNCTNLLNNPEKNDAKIVPVRWPEDENKLFIAGLKIKGDDSPGILNDISHSIVTFQNTNIKSVNINSSESTFDGTITLYVHNLEHLERIIEKLKKIKGIFSVERFEGI